MLSTSMRLEDFADKVRGKKAEEVAWLAHQEATEADRLFFSPKTVAPKDRDLVSNYAAVLKDFILFLNYGVKTQALLRIERGKLEAFRPGFGDARNGFRTIR